MNNATRKQIAKKSNEQLDDDIALYERKLAKTPKFVSVIKPPVVYRDNLPRTRLQAHYEERQFRMLGEYSN